MSIKSLIPAITVENTRVAKEYYQKVFAARVSFDCGWYIDLHFNDQHICFMEPQNQTRELFGGIGLTLNFLVDDVDGEYKRMQNLGAIITTPLDDHPWGDRGFGIVDPFGIALYFYELIEPEQEFKQYFLE